MTEDDWQKIGQNVWFQDFPKLSSSDQAFESPFSFTLKKFLASCDLGTSFLNEYDFSGANAQLVVSIPGYHQFKDGDMRMGFLQLQDSLSSFPTIPWKETIEDELFLQASSIGAIDRGQWFNKFLMAVGCPKNTEKLTLKRQLTTETRPTVKPKIVFPTFANVKESLQYGKDMICLQEDFYKSGSFPKEIFCSPHPPKIYKEKSREDLLLHSKIFLRLLKHNLNDEEVYSSWCYAGSHNLSPSAWGKYSTGGTFHIANYEIGVVLMETNSKLNRIPWISTHNVLPFSLKAPMYKSTDVPYLIPS